MRGLSVECRSDEDGRYYAIIFSEPDHTPIARSVESYETETRAFSAGFEIVQFICRYREPQVH